MKWLSMLVVAVLLAWPVASGATGTAQPLAPSGSVTQTQTAFTWSAASGATWYWVWLNKDGQSYYNFWQQGTAWTPSWNLQNYPGNYEWWVDAWGVGGYGAWSSSLKFTIGGVTLLSPTGTVTQTRPAFTWTAASGATWYHLWMSKGGQYYYSQWLQSTSFTPWWDLAVGSYRCWVEPWGPSTGYGPWSSERDFTVAAVGAAMPLTPSGTATGTRRPTFTWTAANGAAWYHLWLNKEGQSYLEQWVPSTTWTPTSDLPLGNYQWWVQTWNANGYGPWSSGLSFSLVPDGMVLIPAGLFLMGEMLDADAYALPVHTVSVSAVYMDRCSVTKALWDEVKNWNGGNGYVYDNAGAGKAANHPVQMVNWYDVVKWCNARSQKEGRAPVYCLDPGLTQTYMTGQVAPYVKWSANGYRLPTEAEWEKAAQGGAAGHRFPWTDSDTIQHARANYISDIGIAYDTSPTAGFHPTYATGGYPYTSPVGSFAPNGYGLYDMAGNVSAFCWDWYSPSYYSSSPGTDPRGPSSGSYRVVRGGSWSDDATSCRVGFRGGQYPGGAGNGIGFRTVLPPGP